MVGQVKAILVEKKTLLCFLLLSISVALGYAITYRDDTQPTEGLLESKETKLLLENATKTPIDEREDLITQFRYVADARATPFLIECMQSSNARVRSTALLAIEENPDCRAVDAVLLALNDPDEDVQVQALAAAIVLNDRQCVKPIRQLFAKRPSAKVLSMAVAALGEFQEREYVEELIKLYQSSSSDDELCRHIVGALGKFGDLRAFDLISNGFQDKAKYPIYRKVYGEALIQMPDVSHVKSLLAVWKDEKELMEMRSYAASRLSGSCSDQALHAAEWVLKNHESKPMDRLHVVRSLGKRAPYRAQRNVVLLLKCAAQGPEECVRKAAELELCVMSQRVGKDEKTDRLLENCRKGIRE